MDYKIPRHISFINLMDTEASKHIPFIFGLRSILLMQNHHNFEVVE